MPSQCTTTEKIRATITYLHSKCSKFLGPQGHSLALLLLTSSLAGFFNLLKGETLTLKHTDMKSTQYSDTGAMNIVRIAALSSSQKYF